MLGCLMHGPVSKGAPSIFLATFKLRAHISSLLAQLLCVLRTVLILRHSPFSSSDFTYAVLLILLFNSGLFHTPR